MGHIRRCEGVRGVTFQACWRDGQGRQRTATLPTKAAAQTYLRQVEADTQAGSYVDPLGPRTTVAAWVEQWLPTQDGRAAATRAQRANAMSKHVLPRWGDVQLGSIRTLDVQAWVAQLSTQYAPNTVRSIHSLLKQVLTAAVRQRMIGSNPAVLDRGDLPTAAHRALTYLDAADMARLVEAAPQRHQAMLHLTCWTGMRYGEVTALRWSDVQVPAPGAPGIVHVRRSAVDIDGKVAFGPTKTAAGTRSIVLDEASAERFDKHRAERGAAAGSDELCFPNIRGGPQRRSAFHSSPWTPLLARTGLQGTRFHDLRHSHASVMIAAGMNILTLSRRLGHSTPAMTLNVYAHLQRDHVDATLEAIRRATEGQ